MDYIKDPVVIIRQKYFDNKIENEKMVNTKITEELEIKVCNYSITPNINGLKQVIIWMMKKLLRIQNHQVIR